MLEARTESSDLTAQLMMLARDPEIRQTVHDQIGEYCHQGRNLLNSLKLGLYLANRQAAGRNPNIWNDLNGHYTNLERMFERFQLMCRPMNLSKVRIDLELLIGDRLDHWSRLMANAGGRLDCSLAKGPAVAAFDPARLGSAFDGLVGWRATGDAVGSVARLGWGVEDGHAYLSWDEAVRSPSSNLSSSGPTHLDAWPLPILARVIHAHGGDLRIATGEGWRLHLSWPADAP